MNAQIKTYLSAIGRKGGARVQAELDAQAQARAAADNRNPESIEA